jgi:hypothetical protein
MQKFFYLYAGDFTLVRVDIPITKTIDPIKPATILFLPNTCGLSRTTVNSNA